VHVHARALQHMTDKLKHGKDNTPTGEKYKN